MIVVRVLRRLYHLISFVLFFLKEVVLANAWVAWEVMTPTIYMRPGIIRVPTRCTSDLELTFLANLISFTPGTLSLEIAEDKSAIYVHGLHIVSPDDFRRRITELEDRLLRVTR